jgi:nitroreductase
LVRIPWDVRICGALTDVHDHGQERQTMDMHRRRTELADKDGLVLLAAATAAPSLHNSQPWSFVMDARQVTVYADPSRQLTRADPSGRSLLISCGAALFNLRVAAEHLGFHPRVHVLPGPGDPTLVANVNLGSRHPHGGVLAAYYPAIAARRTNRLPFHDRSIPQSALASLAEAARAENAMLRIFDDPDDVSRIVDLIHEADLSERDDPAVRVERQGWIGRPHRDDGIPARSLGPRPEEPRTPFRDLGHDVGVERDYARFESTPTVAVLSTLHDERVDWVRAGEAVQRVLLAATGAGLAASFMNQPLENEALRAQVRSALSGVGHSHMIMRVGYGDPVPATPRRPLSEVRRPGRG